MAPRTRYARSGDLSIAYQVIGDGPVDLVQGPGFLSHLEYAWEEPGYARYLRRLASFSRLILFDKRGTGLSDRAAGIASLADRMDDVRAVMDAAGSERAMLYGVSESALLATLFAATYPERTAALILYGAYASEVRASDYPWPQTAEEYTAEVDERALTIHETWGNVDILSSLAPTVADDPAFRAWFGAFLRMAASPGASIDLERMNGQIDIRHILPSVHVPTLILHRTGELNMQIEQSHYVAARIHGAQLVELPGIDHLPFVGEVDALVDEIEAFVTGMRPVRKPNLVLATILVIETSGAAGQAVALGDRRWTDLQARFQAMARRELERFGGHIITLGDDRVEATFDGPARAIRCARAIDNGAREVGVATRAGLHTGKCEVRDDRASGVAVSLARWVSSQAISDEILVSSTVKDLVAGAELQFADRGRRPLGGTPDEWQLFAVLPDGMERAESAFPIRAVLPIPLPTMLTRREREVLPLAARGFSNRQIADTLSISERTAESHVASILAKWGMSSRAQIAARTAGDDTSASR